MLYVWNNYARNDPLYVEWDIKIYSVSAHPVLSEDQHIINSIKLMAMECSIGLIVGCPLPCITVTDIGPVFAIQLHTVSSYA